jgi:hypothetical protein
MASYLSFRPSGNGPATSHEADDGEDQGDYKNDFGNSDSRGGDATEAEDCCDECDQKECKSPGKHGYLLWLCIPTGAADMPARCQFSEPHTDQQTHTWPIKTARRRTVGARARSVGAGMLGTSVG